LELILRIPFSKAIIRILASAWNKLPSTLGWALALHPFCLAAQAPFNPAQIPAPQELSVPIGAGVFVLHAAKQEKTGSSFHASGDVEVTYLDMQLKADEVWGNLDTKELEGQGHIVYFQGEQQVRGERFKLNWETKTGVFYQAKGKIDPGFIFEADEVEKIGDGKYRLKRGIVTACEDKVPKWSFVVHDAQFQVDSHLTASRTWFRVRRIPLFFFPYLIAPTSERDRQSGFLIPHTSNSSTRGRSFGDAFYLTLGRSADLLARAEYFSLRGMAGELEFRARPSANSRIYAEGFFANEYLQPESDRHNGQSARIIADTLTESGYRAVADIDIVSSQTFRQYYGDTFETITRPDIVSLAYVSRNFTSYSFNFLGEHRSNRFDSTADLPTRNVIIRTLPGVDLFGQSQRLGDWPAYFNLDLAAGGLSRVTTEEGGQVFPGEPQTSPLVARVDFFPRLTLPLVRFRQWSWTQRLGLRETYYSDRLDPATASGTVAKGLSRTAFLFESSWVGPAFERQFMLEKLRIKHVITPEVTYRYITGIHNAREIIRFDERDALGNTNEVEYLLNNRFYSASHVATQGSLPREWMSIQFGQKYFMNPTFDGALIAGERNVFFPLNTLSAFAYADTPREYSPIFTRVQFSPWQHYSANFRMDYDPLIGQIRATSLTGRAQFANDFLGMTYYNTSNLPPNQVGSNQLAFTVGHGSSMRKGVNAAFSLVYDFRTNITQYSTTQVAYNWDCCGVAVELRRYNVGVRVESQTRFTFWLKNIGSFGNMRKQERIF
jgi:LPS-assembly protein